MNQLALTLAGAFAVSGAAFAQDVSNDAPQPINPRSITYAGVYHAATGVFVPAGTAAAGVGPGLGDPIFTNNAPSGFFFDTDDGRQIIDEGRIPSPSSTSPVGTQNSYSISSVQVGYATDSTAPVSIQLEIFENYFPCSTAAGSEIPVATVDLSGLPGSMGGLAGLIVDVDLSGLGVCVRADGRGGFSDGLNDSFGYGLTFTDAGNGTAAGPLIAGDPTAFPPGDGTFFQNPGSTGTGLGALDLFRSTGPGGNGCFFFGGAPFASFWMVVRSDLAGDCIGCGIGDDRFEDDDTQATATPIDFGVYPALIQEQGDINDWFQVTVPPDSGLFVELLFTDAISDLDLVLRDAGGGSLDTGFSASDNELCEFGNCSASPVDVWIQVNNFSDLCNEYDMIVELDALFGDDGLEDNDDCASRVPLPVGVAENLIVRPYCSTNGGDDGDYYGVTLPAGETLTVACLFEHDIADVDTVLYDVTGGCNGTTLVTGFSVTDNEYMQYTNTGATPLDLAVRVDWFRGRSNRYDLVTKVGPATIGELICIGNDNSTGSGARLCATGSDVATDNNLTLDVTSLPANALGYFIVSMDTIFVPGPGGSEGDLCIGSLAIGRYNQNVLDSGAAGAVSFSPDLTQVPIASGGGSGTFATMAGDTLYFQHWTRDADPLGNATSNFSDAICIEFN